MSARDYALAQLDRTPLPGWRVGLIRRRIDAPQDPRDLALAEQIRVGVIKNHALLESVLGHFAKRAGRIDPLVRKITVIGLYQLRFLSRIPASAVVDEAVEQTKRFGRAKASGFVNGLLRNAARHPDVELPKVEDDPVKYAMVVLSHPPDVVRRLFDLLGPEKGLAFCEHDNREPPTLVRVFRDQQLPPDVPATAHEHPGTFVVKGAKRATFAEWANQGFAQVQDPTATRVVESMEIQTGQDVLDRCAGMGTKTLHIRDLLGERGCIMAVDQSEQRCDTLRQLLITRGIANIAIVNASMLTQIRELKEPAFDRMLLDVPCSNSGVLARRPEAIFCQDADSLASLCRLQDTILHDSAPYLRPGGLLMYSTCSVWPEENEHRVREFLKTHPDFEMTKSEVTCPSFGPDAATYHDGGFFALLRRH